MYSIYQVPSNLIDSFSKEFMSKPIWKDILAGFGLFVVMNYKESEVFAEEARQFCRDEGWTDLR